ncbi:MAG: hypothetical protein JNM12_10085 [Alphaproteobacteria bacterium]|nr:hypothetical protein [Alphaproteobacteria bacterium]
MTVSSDTPLSVCNDARLMVGASPVENVTSPATEQEKITSRMYRLVVEALFARHTWSFVNKQRNIAVDLDKVPDGGFKKAFRLPSDLVAGPFAVYANGDFKNPVSEFLHQGDYVHTDYEKIDVLYRCKPDPSIWPASFRLLAVTALAARLAKPVADNTELQTELRMEAFGDARGEGTGGLFAVAKQVDAQTKPMKSIFAGGDPLTNARLGGLSGMRRFRNS